MNKNNFITNYNGLKIIYKSEKTNSTCEYHRGQQTIFIYDEFFKFDEIVQYGLLQHEYFHSLYNKFTPDDVEFWKMIDNKEKLFLTAYSEKMSTQLKGNEESFAEAGKILKIAELKKIDLKFGDFRDAKLQISKYLQHKYDIQN